MIAVNLKYIVSITLFANIVIGGYRVHAQSIDELLNIPNEPEQAINKSNELTDNNKFRSNINKHHLDDQDDNISELLNKENPSDLFKQLILDMNSISKRLKKNQTGITTQREQQNIILKLDQIIAQAKQGQSKSGRDKQKQNQANRDQAGNNQDRQQTGHRARNQKNSSQGENQGYSGQSGSKKVQDQSKQLHEIRSEWGQLPQRIRKEIEEGMSEKFSSKYYQLTEMYYKSIIESSDQDNLQRSE